MNIKYILLRDEDNVIVVSPIRGDRKRCKYFNILHYSSLRSVRGLSGKTIYIQVGLKSEYMDCFSYIEYFNSVVFFEGKLE